MSGILVISGVKYQVIQHVILKHLFLDNFFHQHIMKHSLRVESNQCLKQDVYFSINLSRLGSVILDLTLLANVSGASQVLFPADL